MNPFRAAIDGGSRGNPGPAAWGVVVLADDGTILERHGGFLGRATNNAAEWTALVRALGLAVARRASIVEIAADSELVVKQMRGEYKVRHPDLAPLHAEARALAAKLPRLRIRHVARENNKDADRLVNRVLDLAERTPGPAPLEIHEPSEASGPIDASLG